MYDAAGCHVWGWVGVRIELAHQELFPLGNVLTLWGPSRMQSLAAIMGSSTGLAVKRRQILQPCQQ